MTRQRLTWWRFPLLGVLVSSLALAIVLSQINLKALGTALAQARYVYVVLAALILLVGLVLRALRWRTLLSGSLPLNRAFSIMNMGYLMNAVLPLRIGEVGRIYLAARHDVPMLKTASTILIERLFDLSAALILLGLSVLTVPLPDELRATAAIALVVVFLCFAIVVFLSRQHSLPLEKLSQWLSQFRDGVSSLTRAETLLWVVLYTAVSWGLSTAAGYTLMLAFFEQASWPATFLYMAASSLAVAAPAVLGNLGPFELSILLALGATGYGEPRDLAVAFALVVHGVNLGIHTATGLIGFFNEGISLKHLSQGVQQARLR